jgi:prepilin-type N-terminal cleavage/methylation domain-containing protein
MHSSSSRSAFTLIELLVVIAIIAILAVVVVLTLNPAELLRQSRDSNRLSDLATLTSAINLYNTDQGGASGYSLGTPGVTYLSVPDPAATTTAGSDCTGLGFPSGGAFHCAASSTYRTASSTGWIPVSFSAISSASPISNLPIDPVNTTSSNLYYTYQTDGTTFKLRAIPESTKYLAQAATNQTSFTAGSNPNLGGGPNWVLVPGNTTFGTNNFYVMKYDAVCSDGKGNYLNDSDTGAHTYANNSKLCKTTNGGRTISSLPGGWPIANIWQSGSGTGDDAVTYCASIGAHLITNNEWQTIAWNAESVSSNWSGGSPGNGSIYSGHNDNLGPANMASPASSDDTQGYFGTDGPASGGGTGTNATQKRTLTLSNGAIIWDMAGNIWQWVNATTTGTNEPHGAATGGFQWYQFNDAGMAYNGWTASQVAASTPSWMSTQGVGELYSENQTDGAIYGFLRGGNWYTGGLAGVGALSLGSTPGSTLSNIGFRCAR